MWRYLIVAALLAGCAQLPPSSQDIEARKFESIPGKAAIYIVCESTSALLGAPLWLGQGAQITLWTGNYHRWVVEPGPHTIAAIGVSPASITIQSQAGKVYFVHYRLEGASSREGVVNSALKLMDDQAGRARVMQAVLL
jgi:hypothetical protein